jgi:undecaprenyl-diphosphatase
MNKARTPTVHWYFDPDHHGQLTPAGPVARRPTVTWILLAVLVAAAIVAAIDHGRLFDTWDRPIQEWVEAHRTGALDQFFRGVSRLGSNIVVFPLALVAATLAWFRCRPLAIAIAIAVALRPLFEFVLKDAVGRPRPDLDRMVNGVGYSHPSGHVLATVTLYLLMPAVVALYLGRNRVWQATWVFVALLAPLMAACRVYLGVHWATDAFAGLLWGVVYLAIVGMVFDRHHIGYCGYERVSPGDRRPCDDDAASDDAVDADRTPVHADVAGG